MISPLSLHQLWSLAPYPNSIPQHLEESVVIVKEVINLDAFSDTINVSDQTMGYTIELASGSCNYAFEYFQRFSVVPYDPTCTCIQ